MLQFESQKIIQKMFFFLVIFVWFSSLSFAQYNVFGFKTAVDWIFISYIVVFVILSMLGIAFMISRVFAMRELEAWTRDEFINILFSLAILVFFTMFIGTIETISSSLASDMLSSKSPSGQAAFWQYKNNIGRWNTEATVSCVYPCHFYIARGFLGSLYEKYGQVIESLSKLYFVSALYQTMSVGTNFNVLIFGVSTTIGMGFPSYPELAIYNNVLSSVLSEYLKIITALKMQEIALMYLSSLAGVFFIIGIITRSVWFLRKFGGLLIATGIGLYTIFPLMYVLAWYTIDTTRVIYGDVTITQIDADILNINPLATTGEINNLVKWDELYTNYEKNKVGLLDGLARAYLPIIAVPILAIFTTIGFIRHFSPMIGGDIEIAGLTRII